MCGICGWFELKGKTQANQSTLESMINSIRHRGPDGIDYYMNRTIAMGFCRLSFIDLSSGMQPLFNEDKSICISCNGEIFNYKELKKKLIYKGHSFRTNTDVEVIVHLYEEYGLQFTQYLNGQFAISLYDSRKKSLYLIRDQFGIAPLFYTIKDGVLVYGSEIKAILEYPGIERRINPTAVDQVLNYPGIVAPVTFFEGIYALRPGCMLICCEGEGIREEEYWDIEYNFIDEDLGEKYYIEKLRELLTESIKLRLQADVPIGFYVSGGLDSSVVAAYINKYISSNHCSFSAEVEYDGFNENEYQKELRGVLNSDNYTVRIRNRDIYELLPNVVYYAESAIKENFDVASFLLSELVSTTNVKAVLTGQGADEFFNGYVGYLTDFVRKMNHKKVSLEEQVINERLWGDPFFRYERNHLEVLDISRKLYSHLLRDNYDLFSAIKSSPINKNKIEGLSTQRRRSYIDCKIRLADHLLGDHGDRMFFSHSIEGRHPFLDINLVKFVMAIPEKYKLNGSNEKYILKKAAEDVVPAKIIKRKKYPFSAPGLTYLIKDNQRWVSQYLNKDIIDKHGVFNYDEVEKMMNLYKQPNFNIEGQYHLDYLQAVLTVSMLCEQYGMKV